MHRMPTYVGYGIGLGMNLLWSQHNVLYVRHQVVLPVHRHRTEPSNLEYTFSCDSELGIVSRSTIDKRKTEAPI